MIICKENLELKNVLEILERDHNCSKSFLTQKINNYDNDKQHWDLMLLGKLLSKKEREQELEEEIKTYNKKITNIGKYSYYIGDKVKSKDVSSQRYGIGYIKSFRMDFAYDEEPCCDVLYKLFDEDTEKYRTVLFPEILKDLIKIDD
jgi:hypothetical protein